jgi:hypothetical protein
LSIGGSGEGKRREREGVEGRRTKVLRKENLAAEEGRRKFVAYGCCSLIQCT